ncbi:unnamed protein product [Rhodiola kirilowii]
MGSGRKRIEFRKVEKLQNRRATFTKRRQGLIKKAEQLSSLTGCRVAAIFFSPSCLNPILYGDLSLVEQAAAADADSSVAAIHRHSTTMPASLFADCFQEQSPSVGDNLVDQESLLLLTTAAALEDDQEERCRRHEFLHQMDPCKPLQMVVPTIQNNNYHNSASSSYYYSNIEKKNNNNYGADDRMKMVTREVGSSSRINTTSSNNDYLVQSDQSLLLTACEEDQEEEWRRKELLQMDHHSGCNNIQNNYNCNNYRYSYSSPFSCIEKNDFGAGGRDQMKMVTREVGSSSRNTSDINNIAIANGLMNYEEAQQQLALALAGDDLADSLCMAGEGADLNQLKQRFEAVRQSLLDKLMMADAALSLLS